MKLVLVPVIVTFKFCPLFPIEGMIEFKFCEKCGSELPPPRKSRQQVTALFSDLSEYTALTEKLDPEEIKEITRIIFDGTSQIIRNYERFIETIHQLGSFLSVMEVPSINAASWMKANGIGRTTKFESRAIWT